jgi:hypothetical protein
MRYVLVLLLLTIAGCGGVFTWRTVHSSVSRDGSAEIRVQESSCFADCAVRIVVTRGWYEEQIADGSDCIINFAHAEWFGSVVAVFVDGGHCGPIKAAYDITSNRRVDFKSAEVWLKPAIVKAYKVRTEELQANDGDVFKWATYPGDGRPHRAKHEFRQR